MTKVKREESFVIHWILFRYRENFCGFVSSVLKVQPLLKAFTRKTFVIHQKSVRTPKLFSQVAFVVYGSGNFYNCILISIVSSFLCMYITDDPGYEY